RAAGGRADCDARPGTLAALPPLGSLDVNGPTFITFSPGTESGAELAYLALYRMAPGGLGDAATWQAVSARRFAALTGVLPKIANGTAVPKPGIRDDVAFLDMQATGNGPRRLFLVGPDWPRV